MNPWILLIAQYGIPLAYKIWNEWSNKTNPTQEDWDKLLVLVNTPYDKYIADAQAKV